MQDMALISVLPRADETKSAPDPISDWNLSETAVFSFLGALSIWSIGLIADMIGRLHLRA